MTPARVNNPALLALLSVVTAVLLLAPPARAGCSAHGVKSAGQAGHSIASPRLLELLGPGLIEASGELPPRPRPCTGAFCSGNPAPLSATPSSVPPVDDRACARFVDLASITPALRLPPEVAALRPTHRPGSIFHPPR